ncbi:MAG: hypothetical protein ABTQ32_23010 [Myxococcaceae bacterium]
MKKLISMCLVALSACGPMNPTGGNTSPQAGGFAPVTGFTQAGGSAAQGGGSAQGGGAAQAGGSVQAGGSAQGGGSVSQSDAGVMVVDAGAGPVDAGSPTITVEGTVMTSKGIFVSSATVVITGKQPVTTGPGGRFTIPDVRPPYDIAIFSGVSTRATMYRGVTRANPRLMFFDGATTSGNSTAPIQLTFAGLLSSSTANTWLVYKSLKVNTGDVASSIGMASWLTGTSNTLGFDFTWWASGPADLSVAGLQVVKDRQTNLPVDFTFASLPSVPVVANATIPVTLNMGPVTSTVLNATVNVPAGYTLDSVSTYAKTGNHYFYLMGSTSPNIAIKVPNLPSPGFAIEVEAKDNAGNSVFTLAEGLTAGGAQNMINLPQSPRLSLPIQNAAGIDVQTQWFSWIPVGPGPVSILTFSTPNLTIDVVTFDSRSQIPNLADLGLGTIPTGTTVTWGVSTIESPGTMDGVTDPSRPKLATFGNWVAQTTERTFTAR